MENDKSISAEALIYKLASINLKELLLKKSSSQEIDFFRIADNFIIKTLSDELRLSEETTSMLIECLGINTKSGSELIIFQERGKSGFVAFQIEQGKEIELNNATATILFETDNLENPHLLKMAGINKGSVIAAQYLFEEPKENSKLPQYALKSIDIGLTMNEIPSDLVGQSYLSSLLTYPSNVPSAGFITTNMAKTTGNVAKYNISNVTNFEATLPRDAATINSANDRCITAAELGLILLNQNNFLTVNHGISPIWTKKVAPINMPSK